MIAASVFELLEVTKSTYHSWDTQARPWFRGEPESSTPLLPRLYRKAAPHDENLFVQRFRSMGPVYSSGVYAPPREHNDQWLYIMQHVGAPTRLLDWTEGLLQALFFALEESKAVVWMIDPHQLNTLSGFHPADPRELPIAWGNVNSPAQANLQSAFRQDQGGTDYPVCFIPTYVHPRMAVQRSVFSVHGRLKISIAAIDGLSHIAKFDLAPTAMASMRDDLRLLGMSRRSLFPDYDGLAGDILP